jgi:hypothetical protein
LPTDDTYVRLSKPNSNFGSATSLQGDADSLKHILLKFNVSAVSGTITSARLRLFCTDSSPSGGDIHLADSSWSEGAVTWNNRPSHNPAIEASFGAVSRSNWYELDLTSAVNLDTDGVISLLVTVPSTNGADYSSKEGSSDPQLVLTVQ